MERTMTVAQAAMAGGPNPLVVYTRPRRRMLAHQQQGGPDSAWRDKGHCLTASGWRRVLRAGQAASNALRAGFGPRAVADAAARELADADWFARATASGLLAGLAAKGKLSVDLDALDRTLADHDRVRAELSRYRSPRLAPRRQFLNPQHEPLPVQAARSRPIAEVVQQYGIELRRAGRELVGRCPFHDDHRPSLRVDPARGLWYCFPCDIGGDAIAFVVQLRRLTFAEAVREVAK
jgi:hypothetical protein